MRPVELTLQFITPCYGSVRARNNNEVDHFLRDSRGNVIFKDSWWQKPLEYGAAAIQQPKTVVSQIGIDSVVGGIPRYIERSFKLKGKNYIKMHEGFGSGDHIKVQFMVPDSLTDEQFAKIMEYAGKYVGISPYGWQHGYGKFHVTGYQLCLSLESPVAIMAAGSINE